MTRELRSFDTVARHGGDEFVVLLANVLNADDARKVGEKLLAAVAAPIITAAGPLLISCSVGVAICPEHGETLDTLRRHADQAMYRAKDQGRNAVSVFAFKAADES
jgi:diguanylate cyclase (GGDEF)-like protein